LVPGTLVSLLNNIIFDVSITKALLSSLYYDLFNTIWTIWTQRCDLFEKWKLSRRINNDYKSDPHLWVTSGFLSSSHIIPPVSPLSFATSVNL
ncbi:12900_t:CDS:1, partial [Funneliformis geosporum]